MRQKELSEQAANGVYSLVQRKSMHDESNALVSEFNRISATTNFNGVSLLSGSFLDARIQAGFGTNEGLRIGVGDYFTRLVGDGTFTASPSFNAVAANPGDTATADLNGDGKNDLVVGSAGLVEIYYGNGDGTFSAVYSRTGNYTSVNLVDVNGDGRPDIVGGGFGSNTSVALNQGNGVFANGVNYNNGGSNGARVVVGDLNGDGRPDIVSFNQDSNTIGVLSGNGNGTFLAPTVYSAGLQPSWGALSDFNGDGRLDIVVSNTASGGGTASIGVYLGNGDGSFGVAQTYGVDGSTNIRGSTISDTNNDGYLDIVYANGSGRIYTLFGNGDGSFRARTTSVIFGGTYSAWNTVLADINGDGIEDLVTSGDGGTSGAQVMLGNSDGTFSASATVLASGGGNNTNRGIAIGDLNGDGVPDITTGSFGNQGIYVFNGDGVRSGNQEALYLLTQQGARESLDKLDLVFNRINLELGAIGALQSRLSSASRTLITTRENYTAASSRIQDADVASESAELVKNQILQQAASAVLAQANQLPAISLQLIRS